MATGTVLRFSADKHYGFIKPDGGAEHVMLHERQLRDQRDAARLASGVRVTFVVQQTEKGLRAADVRLLLAGDDEADVLSGEQFRDEIGEVLAGAVSEMEAIARRHGWVE